MLGTIAGRIDSRCLVESMNKQGCEVDTADAPNPFLIIDMDDPASPAGPSSSKCDYLFLGLSSNGLPLWVVPLELTGSGLNPSKVIRQLQAGAQAAERTIGGVPQIRFVPIAAHGRKPHRRAFNKVADARIRFRKAKFRIVTMACGLSIADGLGSAGTP